MAHLIGKPALRFLQAILVKFEVPNWGTFVERNDTAANSLLLRKRMTGCNSTNQTS